MFEYCILDEFKRMFYFWFFFFFQAEDGIRDRSPSRGLGDVYKRQTTDSFNRRLKKYCKEAGVPYHSSHKIRFYNASTAFDGNNLTTLSYLMGHSETATTLHYLRNVNKRKNDRLAFQNLGISS